MYEVWTRHADAPGCLRRFRHLSDALSFIETADDRDVLWLKSPDGTAHSTSRAHRRRSRRRSLKRRVSLRRMNRVRPVDAIVLDGSDGGLRVRLPKASGAVPVGSTVEVGLSTSYERFSVRMRVVWKHANERGLAHVAAEPAKWRTWLNDTSGSNTPVYGYQVIETVQHRGDDDR
jgi:hypothetical protein